MRNYADFIAGYAKFMAVKCMGMDAETKKQAMEFWSAFGKRGQSMEHDYDHFVAVNGIII